MKKADKKSANKTFDQLISKLSENEILNIQAMSYVRGGSTDGEGEWRRTSDYLPKIVYSNRSLSNSIEEHYFNGNALLFFCIIFISLICL